MRQPAAVDIIPRMGYTAVAYLCVPTGRDLPRAIASPSARNLAISTMDAALGAASLSPARAKRDAEPAPLPGQADIDAGGEVVATLAPPAPCELPIEPEARTSPGEARCDAGSAGAPVADPAGPSAEAVPIPGAACGHASGVSQQCARPSQKCVRVSQECVAPTANRTRGPHQSCRLDELRRARTGRSPRVIRRCVRRRGDARLDAKVSLKIAPPAPGAGTAAIRQRHARGCRPSQTARNCRPPAGVSPDVLSTTEAMPWACGSYSSARSC